MLNCPQDGSAISSELSRIPTFERNYRIRIPGFLRFAKLSGIAAFHKIIIRFYLSLMVFFRYLKTLSAGFKTKTCGRKNGCGEPKWRVAYAARNNTQRIMVFGDSNAYRPGSNKKSWPKLLEAQDSIHLNVFNESCDGRTTRYDIGECNGLSVIAEKLTAHEPLDYVIVILGTNDVKNKYGPPSPAGIAEGMSRIIEIIENHGDGAKPILLTPPPLGNVTSGELTGAQSRIPPVIAEYRLMAMNRYIRLVDIYSIMDINTDLEPDMIHLNALGRQKIADAVFTNLQGTK